MSHYYNCSKNWFLRLFLFGPEIVAMIQFWGVYCQFFVNFWESMSEAKIDATGAAERMRKYRKKNQLKNGLTIASLDWSKSCCEEEEPSKWPFLQISSDQGEPEEVYNQQWLWFRIRVWWHWWFWWLNTSENIWIHHITISSENLGTSSS